MKHLQLYELKYYVHISTIIAINVYLAIQQTNLISLINICDRIIGKGLLQVSNFLTLWLCNSTCVSSTALDFGTRTPLSLYFYVGEKFVLTVCSQT